MIRYILALYIIVSIVSTTRRTGCVLPLFREDQSIKLLNMHKEKFPLRTLNIKLETLNFSFSLVERTRLKIGSPPSHPERFSLIFCRGCSEVERKKTNEINGGWF